VISFHLGIWDVVLLVAVSLQATVIAYVHEPRWKAFVLTLPIPFTMAVMSLGRTVDATNVLGMSALLLYTHAVRLLHQRKRVHIILSIALGVAGYCVIGGLLAARLPSDDTAFYVCAGLTVLLALILYVRTPHRVEPGHRSPLPFWLKLPAVALVVVGLILIKQTLGGFMTMCPMVGVVAAYEARHSLWTISRQIPVLMLTMIPFMIVCRVMQERIGLGLSLVAAWIVFILVLIPLTARMWRVQEVSNAD